MLWQKACRQCRGDLALQRDEYDYILSCIQCGNIRYDVPEAILRRARRPGSDQSRRAA